VAFSKVCTHAGCPVGLYQEALFQLLCPCHQSLFNVLQGARPVFGPAPRPLPQLPLYIDDNGFLHAQAGYDSPSAGVLGAVVSTTTPTGMFHHGGGNGAANGTTATKTKPVDGTIRWLDDRLGVAKGGRTLLDKIFPTTGRSARGDRPLLLHHPPGHGRVPVALLRPSAAQVIYHGSYVPLRA